MFLGGSIGGNPENGDVAQANLSVGKDRGEVKAWSSLTGCGAESGIPTMARECTQNGRLVQGNNPLIHIYIYIYICG